MASPALDDDPRLVTQAWLGSRLLLATVALVVMVTQHREWWRVTGAWDVEHFMQIAADGYADKVNMAFFPALPALLHVFSLVHVPMQLAGVLLGLTGSALAAWALYRFAGAIAASLWLFAPTAVFTTVAYTEALFCAAAFWAWERARSGRWLQASLLAAVACSFRVSGLFLIGALVVLAIFGDGDRGRPEPFFRRADHALWLLLPVAVLIAHATYLHHLSGSWTAWFEAQTQGWARGFTTPWQAYQNTLPATETSAWPDRPSVAYVFRAEIVSMGIGVATTLYCLVRRRWASASWVGIQVFAFSISYWFMSVNRAILLWFPLFVALSELVQWRPKGSLGRLLWQGFVTILVVTMIATSIVWAWLYYTGAWAS